MRVRVGLLRAFIAVLWAALLVLPVGVYGPGGPETASVGESLAEVAGGNLDISILGALAYGGELARAALWRLVLVFFAALAFYLAGLLHQPDEPARQVRRKIPCPHCDAPVSTDMKECPHCGRSVRED